MVSRVAGSPKLVNPVEAQRIVVVLESAEMEDAAVSNATELYFSTQTQDGGKDIFTLAFISGGGFS